jgi:hypothetical protein
MSARRGISSSSPKLRDACYLLPRVLLLPLQLMLTTTGDVLAYPIHFKSWQDHNLSKGN